MRSSGDRPVGNRSDERAAIEVPSRPTVVGPFRKPAAGATRQSSCVRPKGATMRRSILSEMQPANGILADAATFTSLVFCLAVGVIFWAAHHAGDVKRARS